MILEIKVQYCVSYSFFPNLFFMVQLDQFFYTSPCPLKSSQIIEYFLPHKMWISQQIFKSPSNPNQLTSFLYHLPLVNTNSEKMYGCFIHEIFWICIISKLFLWLPTGRFRNLSQYSWLVQLICYPSWNVLDQSGEKSSYLLSC